MTNTLKILIAVLVVVVIGGTGAWLYMMQSTAQTVATPLSTSTTTAGTLPASATTGVTGTQGTASAQPAASGSGAVTSSSDSDASLQQDASSIDSQMSGLNSDNASTDQGMNSQ
jgi:hypothetical protein